MSKDTKNFKVSEFTCHCGCGANNIDQRVMDMAQAIRNEVGVPVKVNSGCRCEKNNTAVGGVKGSFHTKGLAADLSCSLGSMALFKAAKKLHEAGKLPDLRWCKRYIIKNFIHIDCGKIRNNIFCEGN